VVFEAKDLEITMAKPAVPQKLPKRREAPETPTPIPDRRPVPRPIELPIVIPTGPINEPSLPVRVPVPSHS
jgi:hypothetical protein